MQKERRKGTDRRSGNDRRVNNSIDYFFEGCERRSWKERRRPDERRAGWITRSDSASSANGLFQD
jgi:hypothetical protein